MMAILILVALGALVAPVAMARRSRKRRWNPNNFVVTVREDLQLGALLAVSLIAGALSSNSDNEYRAISLRSTYALSDFTAGEGPLTIGVAHGAYSAAEIEEWVESQTAMTRTNLAVIEQSKRMVRQIGTFPGISANEVLNDGKPIHTKLNWSIPSGSNIDLWCYNQGNGTLTTSAEINTIGRMFGRWT